MSLAGTASKRGVNEYLKETVGFTPKDPIGWLYASRGLYKVQEYHYAIEALAHCLRNDKTRKEAQHLLAFCLFYTRQTASAGSAFLKSVQLGNETDWQPLVEILLDNADLKL